MRVRTIVLGVAVIAVSFAGATLAMRLTSRAQATRRVQP
jgi:hypothetical protein